TGSFGPYGCPENLSVRFFPNSAGSPFIVKIINWNLSIHNLPTFDSKQAFRDWFLLNDPNKSL
ncbi:hypothetical protein FKK76_25870, partial [Klebsiella quasipneumoniae]|nr:hypothetical protein [Klebsiella quasipneumoniae]